LTVAGYREGDGCVLETRDPDGAVCMAAEAVLA
jgi:hypothetical protein